MPTATAADHTETARRASRRSLVPDLEGIPRDYHPEFVDHVNRLTYHGHQGARRSVALYLALFPDLTFEVNDQVAEGDKVASCWTLRGTHRGRKVELRGIVISRFEDGRIIEDWAASDTMELVRQLGLWRTLQPAVKHRKLLFGKGNKPAACFSPRRAFDNTLTRLSKSLLLDPQRDRSRPPDLRQAGPKYDKSMARFERLLFSGNRDWACSRADGDVLEIAAGTARNLPFYPEGVRVTGVELQPGDGRAGAQAGRGPGASDRHASRRRRGARLPR